MRDDDCENYYSSSKDFEPVYIDSPSTTSVISVIEKISETDITKSDNISKYVVDIQTLPTLLFGINHSNFCG